MQYVNGDIFKIAAFPFYRNIKILVKVIWNISCKLKVKNTYPCMSVTDVSFGGTIKCLTF